MTKRISFLFIIASFLFFTLALQSNESNSIYFPNTIGSYWVYVDQNGKEIKRTIIEGEEIAGDIYHAFSYEPAIEDWKGFNRFMHPILFNVGEERISFLVGDEVEKAVKERLKHEMDIFSNYAKLSLQNNSPPDLNLTANIDYKVQSEAEEQLYFFPIEAAIDEEWRALEVNAAITMKFDIQGVPDFQGAEEMQETTLNFNILESGKILGTETVETLAGPFEDCLKIEFRTKTKMTATEPTAAEESPGESVTTIWLSQNVGIVKYHQEAENIFLHLFSEREIVESGIPKEDVAEFTSTYVKTFALKEYNIKPILSQNNSN